jgi:hypothetical protein
MLEDFEEFVWDCWRILKAPTSPFWIDESRMKGLENQLSVFHRCRDPYEFRLYLEEFWGTTISFKTTDETALNSLWESPSIWLKSEEELFLLIGPAYFLNHHCKSSLQLQFEQEDRQFFIKQLEPSPDLKDPFSSKGEILVQYGENPPEECICSYCKEILQNN